MSNEDSPLDARSSLGRARRGFVTLPWRRGSLFLRTLGLSAALLLAAFAPFTPDVYDRIEFGVDGPSLC